MRKVFEVTIRSVQYTGEGETDLYVIAPSLKEAHDRGLNAAKRDKNLHGTLVVVGVRHHCTLEN